MITPSNNYLSNYIFHSDISRFLYYADSPLKNYEHKDLSSIMNLVVFSGNFTNGFNIYSDEEPSALYTQYKIIKPTTSVVGKLPHYPRYRALNPYQRYQYIQFLTDPYTKTDLCYCYLLLYCLERRLLEGDTTTIPVMLKLANFHGGKFQNSVLTMLENYNLWKSGKIYPMNCKVFCNYTLRVGFHKD